MKRVTVEFTEEEHQALSSFLGSMPMEMMRKLSGSLRQSKILYGALDKLQKTEDKEESL